MMITCIESAGPLVISGSTDKSVSLWDVRWGPPGCARGPMLRAPPHEQLFPAQQALLPQLDQLQ